MMKSFSYEKRYLKRPKLGPPDVYPQEPKQKEDELTVNNVKHGFACLPQLNDEYGSARNCPISASKVTAYYNAILAKKDEKNTLPDSGRKRQQINPKDNFWPATARTKSAVEAWFRDLAGSKSLLVLSKKAPNFNKKEEIFSLLNEFQVPMVRAAWFIKLSSAYTVAVSEAKIKKRQLPDPAQEWTSTILKFLKEQLTKLAEIYQSSPQGPMNDEQNATFRLWHYTLSLLRHLYQEGLVERWEVLSWVLEQVEWVKAWGPSDDGPLRLILPVVLQYLEEFSQNELLSRKLACVCAGRLAQLTTAQATPSSPNSPNHNSQTVALVGNVSTNNVVAIFQEYMNCSHHKDIILGLSAVIQVITLECPTALVWNSIGEGKSPSVLNGSPMEALPCLPSSLPMPLRNSNQNIRNQLKFWEDVIKQRSAAAENKWSCDKWQQNCAGVRTHKVLAVLEALDRHSFTRVDPSNSLDTLYSKIFSTPPDKSSYIFFQSLEKDEAIVETLCWWAVSRVRYGEHRAIAVAKLLERRSAAVAALAASPTHDGDQADADSAASLPPAVPVFQTLLMKFLDTDAPVHDDMNTPVTSNVMFTNLVHLFSELIRHDVFSHDAYMCTLISRGDLLSAPNSSASMGGTPHPNSNKPLETPTTQMYLDSDPSMFDLKPNKMSYSQDHGRTMECDDSKAIDDDLDKLLQTIKEDQQNSMDAPDSPKVEDAMGLGTISALDASCDPTDSVFRGRPSRHLQFTTHFPLPQDETSSHECNQRHVLLYGFGKARDDARHAVKRTSKDICKLFSKKFSIDVAEGGKVKKHSRNEFNFEATTARMQNLSYFDQHVVTWQCSSTVLEMISSFASGNSNYLPVQEHVAFLFDLMELALNINGLIDICIQILKEIPDVEAQLAAKSSNLIRFYTCGLVLYIVGVLRRYHCCLLLSPEQTVVVFEGLCKVTKHISNPCDCWSAERCILSHLYDLYSSCTSLKTRPHSAEPFSNAYPKIRVALYNSLTPSQSGSQSASPFMADVIATLRKSGSYCNYRHSVTIKVESNWAKQLNESASNRYSFVCNVVVAVCTTNDVDRLNDLGHLCSELTACCNQLSSEWLGVLAALCYSSTSSSHVDVLSRVDIHDLSTHNSLSVFTSILVARHCFSLEDFVVHVALPSLLAVYHKDGRGDSDIDTEAGARLTCHLLLRLFKTAENPQPSLYTVGTSPHPLPVTAGSSSIKLSCDRHLLAAAHNNIKVGPVLAILKAILVVGDVTAGRGNKARMKPHKATPPSSSSQSAELSISLILGTSDHASAPRDDILDLGVGRENAGGGGLSELSQYCLKEICCEEWVLERCLQRPEDLCTQDMMLDSMLSPRQAHRLLHMICYPDRSPPPDAPVDHKTIVTNILENLEQWTLRVSWLDMQLMLKQFPSGSVELNQWLEIVAKAAINLFNIHSGGNKGKNQAMWLVAPLISKMPSSVQGRVLKVAGQVLESSNWFPSGGGGSGGGGGRSKGGTPTRPSGAPPGPPVSLVHHHQPFLALVLTCLKGQDDQRDTLLTSLHSQLNQCLQIAKDEKSFCYESPKVRSSMQDALLLRFSLIGGMFDTIQRNTSLTTDWALTLVQLVTHSVIDLNNNSELFYTVIDMLATLIHSTLVSDSQSEKGEENRKYYQNLMKKLKKEVGEKQSPSLLYVKQLLPLAKKMCEVIACGQMGLLTDMKGNKINFDSSNEKPGLCVAEKQRVSCWDIVEGQKNPAPLSWPWFGAIRIERKPLPYEETHRLLQSHTHSLVQPPEHYLDPLPLPPEDIDPPNKPMKGGPGPGHEGAESPRGKRAAPGKQPPIGRSARKKPKPPTPTVMHHGPGPGAPGGPGMGGQMGGYQGGQMGGYQGGQPGPQGWGQPTPPYPQQHTVQPQQLYYQPQHQQQQQQMQQAAAAAAIAGGPTGRVNQSKQALSNMLRMRMPTANQYLPQAQPQMTQNFQPIQRPNMFRSQLGNAMGGGPGPMQGQQMQGMGLQQMQQSNQQMFPTSQQMYPNMQPQGMGQNYGGYSGGGMVSNSGMFPDTMMRQPDYQQRVRPPYMQGQAPNVTMSSMGGPLSQPAPPYSRPTAPMNQQQPFPQQMSTQRMRHQLLLQQQQVGGQGGGQGANNIVSQLQRQMQQHPSQQQQQQQHHSLYQQQPPPYWPTPSGPLSTLESLFSFPPQN